MSRRSSFVDGDLVRKPIRPHGIEWVVAKPAEGVTDEALTTALNRDARVASYDHRGDQFGIRFRDPLDGDELKQFLADVSCIRVVV